jgi:hypothetical protein
MFEAYLAHENLFFFKIFQLMFLVNQLYFTRELKYAWHCFKSLLFQGEWKSLEENSWLVLSSDNRAVCVCP